MPLTLIKLQPPNAKAQRMGDEKRKEEELKRSEAEAFARLEELKRKKEEDEKRKAKEGEASRLEAEIIREQKLEKQRLAMARFEEEQRIKVPFEFFINFYVLNYVPVNVTS